MSNFNRNIQLKEIKKYRRDYVKHRSAYSRRIASFGP